MLGVARQHPLKVCDNLMSVPNRSTEATLLTLQEARGRKNVRKSSTTKCSPLSRQPKEFSSAYKPTADATIFVSDIFEAVFSSRRTNGTFRFYQRYLPVGGSLGFSNFRAGTL